MLLPLFGTPAGLSAYTKHIQTCMDIPAGWDHVMQVLSLGYPELQHGQTAANITGSDCTSAHQHRAGWNAAGSCTQMECCAQPVMGHLT